MQRNNKQLTCWLFLISRNGQPSIGYFLLCLLIESCEDYNST